MPQQVPTHRSADEGQAAPVQPQDHATAPRDATSEVKPAQRARNVEAPPEGAGHADVVEPKRPFGIPEEVVYDDLPRDVRLGYQEIVVPCVEALIAGETRPLAKILGLTLCHQTMKKILTHHVLVAAMARGESPEVIDRLLARDEKVLKHEARAADLLLRLEALQAERLRKDGPLGSRIGGSP